MHYVNKTVLTASDGSSKNGDTQDSQLWVSASFHFYSAGSIDGGNLKIQASNDPVAAGYSPGATLPTITNWVDLTNQFATISGGAGAIITISVCSYRWMRAVYTKSSGTDAYTVNVMAIYP